MEEEIALKIKGKKKNSIPFWHSSLQLSAMGNAQEGLGEEGERKGVPNVF